MASVDDDLEKVVIEFKRAIVQRKPIALLNDNEWKGTVYSSLFLSA